MKINYQLPHEKICLERCQILLQGENLENFALITDASVCFPDKWNKRDALSVIWLLIEIISLQDKVIGLIRLIV